MVEQAYCVNYDHVKFTTIDVTESLEKAIVRAVVDLADCGAVVVRFA